ncbi:alpha/beta hydrolase [Erythrobacter sp.]|uniref:alpha/beta fold hydrolase n=1 Tax=Sphingomonadales TaxID=204457 RepID=UPI0032655B95
MSKRYFVDVGGLDVFVNETGKADGPPLLLLHGGWATGKMNWSSHFSWLGQKYRIISPDSRGHGKTPDPTPSETTYATIARDNIALCKALCIDGGELTIMGHSAGAAVGMIISAIVPNMVAKQVLIAIAMDHGLSDKHRAGMRAFFHTHDHRFPPKKWDYVWRHPFYAIALKQAHKRANWYQLLVDAWPRWISPLPIGVSDLEEIVAETIVISGCEDEFVAVAEAGKLAARLPGPPPKFIDGMKHMFVIEKPQKLQESVADFLDLPIP